MNNNNRNFTLQVISVMETYSVKLKTNLDCIQKSYDELELDFPDKV